LQNQRIPVIREVAYYHGLPFKIRARKGSFLAAFTAHAFTILCPRYSGNLLKIDEDIYILS